MLGPSYDIDMFKLKMTSVQLEYVKGLNSLKNLPSIQVILKILLGPSYDIYMFNVVETIGVKGANTNSAVWMLLSAYCNISIEWHTSLPLFNWV